MKLNFLFLIVLTFAINNSLAQNGNFSDLTFDTVTKGGGFNDYYGWGTNPNNTLTRDQIHPMEALLLLTLIKG